MLDIVNSLWVEKHRPLKLDELVLPEDYKEDFQICIQKNVVPHLLLSGPPGSGKTCIAQILCSKYGIIQSPDDNVLLVDGSKRESRGIGFVEDVIEQYLKIPPASPDQYKIVFIDEADQLTESSFKSLRHIMEKYSGHTRFILTCNYISKIEDAVQSRCQHYVFKQMPVEFVFNYCKKILELEKIDFDEKDIRFIIQTLYPDIRKIINTIQKNSMTGKLKVNRSLSISNEKTLISYFVEIISFIQNGQDHKVHSVINSAVKLLGEIDLDYRMIYTDLFFRDGIPTSVKIVINKYSNTHNDCLVPSMHFCALLFEAIQVLQKYKEMVGKK